MELTREEMSTILGMFDTIEDDYGLSSWELELKEKIERLWNENEKN